MFIVLLKALPVPFNLQYGQCIPQNVNIVLRNGDVLKLQYSKDKETFTGMVQIFERFDCRNGCIIVIDYNGADKFSLHIIVNGIEEYGGIFILFSYC